MAKAKKSAKKIKVGKKQFKRSAAPKIRKITKKHQKAVVGKTTRPAGVEKIRIKKQQYTLQKTLLANSMVRSHLIDVAGENTINVLREFTCELSDEELAKKAKMKVSDVRIVLNKLHSLGMAQYARSRDKDSGWYSYVWRLDEGKEKEILMPVYQNKGAEGYVGEKCVASGEGDQYFCAGCGKESVVDFETAMDRQFKCSSCGNDLSFFEKKK
ncbi:Transcription factor E [Candidatus Anstonella stagnisolia]|nr:Transcription factor E [Candidatus Anstonella stagnisolia]